jgi:hypothetical protein
LSSTHRSRAKRWDVEGSAQFGELIQSGRLDPPVIQIAGYQAITFGSSESVSEHLVRDAVEGIIEFLVAAAPVL